MKFIYFLIILLLSQIINSQNSFTAKIDISAEVVEGEYNKVVLDIYKPQGARNFTVFTQKLPVGFFVKMIDAQGAIYSYENNILSLTWLRCPSEKKISVKYEVSSMLGISGSFYLSGKLTYMVGSQQATYTLKRKNFKLVKKKTVFQNEKELNFKPIQEIRNNNVILKGLTCKRKISFNKTKNYYKIELEFKTKNKGRYSIVESIPMGFEFLEIDSHEAKLLKKSNLVQYLWVNSSITNNLIIKYRLVPITEKHKTPKISGKLSYLNNGQILNINILSE